MTDTTEGNKPTKDIKGYLHLYLGCPFIYNNGTKIWEGWSGFEKTDTYYYTDEERNHIKLGGNVFQVAKIKLVLRPLSDITEEEIVKWHDEKYPEYKDYSYTHKRHFLLTIENKQFSPEYMRHLLSKHFDLFGLIDEGLAIDKTTLNTQSSSLF